jgi:prepilin-type processing-associated H-X9-DG protein
LIPPIDSTRDPISIIRGLDRSGSGGKNWSDPAVNPLKANGSVDIFNNAKPKYFRCPSDGYALDQSLTNYAGSLGPQCLTTNGLATPCPQPNQPFCNRPDWGYSTSPDHGNSFSNADIRGMFNRLGAKINIASVKDGTSNTILVGEFLPQEHDHHSSWQGNWASFNYGAAHHGTLPPINYKTDMQVACNQAPTQSYQNWNLAWGFKSNHSGGANFLFGDGSVHFINQGIDYRTYQLLGCRNDGQPVDQP